MKMIVALRLKKRRELSIFLEKTSILGNESFFFRKGLANPEKTKDYLHSLG